MTDQTITMESAIRQVIDQLDGPTPLDEVVQRVLAIRPSHAKNPAQAIRNNIRQIHRPTWVWLDERTLIPLRLCMRGVRFRITPSRTEVERGVLLILPALQGFIPAGLTLDAVQWVDRAGKALDFDVATVKERLRSPIGDPYTVKHTGFRLGAWFKQVGFRRGDSLLVTGVDWEAGRFQIEHEPAGQRRSNEISRRNQELADRLFSVLEEGRYEWVADAIAVPTAYARLAEPGGYPGDHWTEILRQDPRMKWMGSEIRYTDFITPLEAVFLDKPPTPIQSFSRQQGQQVYRCKAALKYRPGLWRRIEIQGRQTLGDLDQVLRMAFEHDPDHMSGFWKRVRRAKSRRFREVDLGDINPFGEGEAAEMPMAGLGLQPGDEIKYVYDFGDWIEHTVALEEIIEPEAGATYPRIVAQNKPRYRYCERCKAQGRKTVAVWICIDCSNREQREVLVCDSCAEDAHEDHYLDEVLY